MRFENASVPARRASQHDLRLRMRPLCSDDRTAAVVVAAARSGDGNPLSRSVCEFVAFVRLSPTAGTLRRSRGRQHDRNQASGQSEQQQKSGDQALHVQARIENLDSQNRSAGGSAQAGSYFMST
jgi:hypothetical protein